MTFELPELPYSYDALEPYVSAQTLTVHHRKHHKAYVAGLNRALAEGEEKDLSLEELIQRSAGKELERSIFNAAAQSWNHDFFWRCMSPGGGGRPGDQIARQIDADFGDFSTFRHKFINTATGQFGSGWVWLVMDRGRLEVTATPNAELPLIHGQHALLTCDVWEHAYYLDYKNERDKFVAVFLDTLVNWDFVAERFTLAHRTGNVPAGRVTTARVTQEPLL